MQVFLYVMGLQLLLSNGLSSLMAGGAGLVAGLVWRANPGGLQRLRVRTQERVGKRGGDRRWELRRQGRVIPYTVTTLRFSPGD